MKILRITVQGLPLFKQELDIAFYAQQRVSEDDKETLFKLLSKPTVYLHAANAFIGINASGKTSVLKAIQLALHIVKNEPINHVDAKTILGGTNKAVFRICFYDANQNICCLETEITSQKTKAGDYVYSIVNEKLWEKPVATVQSKKVLTDFSGLEPGAIRNENEMFLSDDVSFIIDESVLLISHHTGYAFVERTHFVEKVLYKVIALKVDESIFFPAKLSVFHFAAFGNLEDIVAERLDDVVLHRDNLFSRSIDEAVAVVFLDLCHSVHKGRCFVVLKVDDYSTVVVDVSPFAFLVLTWGKILRPNQGTSGK